MSVGGLVGCWAAWWVSFGYLAAGVFGQLVGQLAGKLIGCLVCQRSPNPLVGLSKDWPACGFAVYLVVAPSIVGLVVFGGCVG